MQTAGNPKTQGPFVVLDGKNDYCPVVVERNADAIALAGAKRLIDTIISLGGKADIKSSASLDELSSVSDKAIILCRKAGNWKKT